MDLLVNFYIFLKYNSLLNSDEITFSCLSKTCLNQKDTFKFLNNLNDEFKLKHYSTSIIDFKSFGKFFI